jgi:hypothetical protein
MMLMRGIVAIVVSLMLSPTTYGQTALPIALANDDIVRMVQAKLPPDIIIATIESTNFDFDLSPGGLILLKGSGVEDRVIQTMQAKTRERESGATTDAVTRSAPENSRRLATSKDPAFILHNFRTLLVNASDAQFFDSAQMKAELGRNKEFAALNIAVVDDPAVADVTLDVSYTFAWDYPFSLRHQNTSIILLSGKGSGPFSGPSGATSVADELTRLLKPYRNDPQPLAPGKK